MMSKVCEELDKIVKLISSGYTQTNEIIFDPIYLFISYILASIVILKTVHATNFWHMLNFMSFHQNKKFTIYLSFCNLTPEQINTLLDLLTEGRTYYIYLNGNNLGLTPDIEEKYFTPLEYTKTVNNNTFEKLKTEVLALHASEKKSNNDILPNPILQQIAGSRFISHKKRKYTKKTYTTK